MNNKSTVVIDGVVYSADKKVLIKYPNDKNETVFRIPDFVEEIAEECFMDVKPPKKVYMGNNVKKICNNAIGDQCTFCIRQIYIPPTVVELEGEIFDQGVADSGEYYPVDVVGGQKDSTIEFYCNERGIPFVYVAPDEVEKFYSMSTKELIDLAKSQAESINEFVIDEGEKGYQMTFANGTLTVCATSNAPANVVVEKTRVRINEFLRPKVQKLVISNGITGIADLAFDSYDNLEQIYIGADVSVISPMAFTGRESGTSWGCPKLSAITVDEQNKWYKSVDGVLFTHDMQTLVKYCPATPGLYYEVDSQVRYIGKLAFTRAKNLQCLKIGEGCVSVGKLAFLNISGLRHVYFSDSVVEWPACFPFVGMNGYDRPYLIPDLVLAGAKGSAVSMVCDSDGTYFCEIEEDEIDDFLATPLPNVDDDKYLQHCKKQMIVSADGTLQQVGEIGEELVFPEGVVRTRYAIDLSACKKVVIPSTLSQLWAEGFYGEVPDLKEFVVSPDNKHYRAMGGHLYSVDGTLLSYAPGANDDGVLPEQTAKIAKSAFKMIAHAIDRLYIPKNVTHIEPQRAYQSGWFCHAEVSPENTAFKAIEGSIFTVDGSKLVQAKNCNDCFVVPQGTQVIGRDALFNVQGCVTIPASVTKIEDSFGFGYGIKKIVVARGSYAEWYAKKSSFKGEIAFEGEVDELWTDEKEEQNKKPSVLNYDGNVLTF